MNLDAIERLREALERVIRKKPAHELAFEFWLPELGSNQRPAD